jgi:hypothetical protein
LTNYIYDYFSDAFASTANGTIYGPASPGAESVIMLDNNGNPISYPALLGPTGIWFQAGCAR